jgi:hypothetical protein
MKTFDAAFVRDYRPDYSSVFSESAHDAWTLLLRRKVMVLVLLAGVALLAIPVAFFMPPLKAGAGASAVNNAAGSLEGILTGAYYLAIVLVSVYALADSIRTVRPEFHMTFGGLLAIIGLSLLVGLVVDVGLLLFIIPGFWIGVKLSQTIYAYFLRPGRGALAESWNITTGHFWPTLGFYIVLGFFVGFAMLLPFYVALFFSLLYPLSAIVMIPFVFAIWSFMQYFNSLVHVRWTEALLRSDEIRRESIYAPVPSA